MSTTAHIATTNPIQWSSGDLFDGYALLGIAFPTVSGVAYPSVSNGGLWPALRIPQWIRVPIAAGKLNTSTTVDFTTSIEPPNSRYCCYWYDSNNVRIAGPSPNLFSILTDPYIITPPSLPVPTIPVVAPTPDTTTSGSPVVIVGGGGSTVTIVGSYTGTNLSANLALTLLANAPAGFYRINGYIATNSADLGMVTTVISYTDDLGAATLNTPDVLQLTAGNRVTDNPIFKHLGGDIAFTTTRIAPGTYNLDLLLERIVLGLSGF